MVSVFLFSNMLEPKPDSQTLKFGENSSPYVFPCEFELPTGPYLVSLAAKSEQPTLFFAPAAFHHQVDLRDAETVLARNRSLSGLILPITGRDLTLMSLGSALHVTDYASGGFLMRRDRMSEMGADLLTLGQSALWYLYATLAMEGAYHKGLPTYTPMDCLPREFYDDLPRARELLAKKFRSA